MNSDHIQGLETLEKQLLLLSQAHGAPLQAGAAQWARIFPGNVSLDCQQSDLYGYIFFGPRSDAPLSRSNFKGAMLSRTTWLWSTIHEADFTQADLSGCKMESVRASGATFADANLTDARLRFFVLDDDRPIDFSNATLRHATFVLDSNCTFILSGADLTNVEVEIVDVEDKQQRQNIKTSFLEKLTPEQRSQVKETESSRCYIATVVYGDCNHAKVATLRDFRDYVLRRKHLGRLFIRTYERVSPTMARSLSGKVFLTWMIRSLLDAIVAWAGAILRRQNRD